MKLQPTWRIVGALLLCLAAFAGASAAQELELWVDGQPAWYWMYPELDQPFSVELRLVGGSGAVRGMETRIAIYGTLEILSISIHNDAEYIGSFVPFEEVPGGVQELQIADFGECVQASEHTTLVDVRMQYVGDDAPCSVLQVGGMDWNLAPRFLRCEDTWVGVGERLQEAQLWCPDDVAQLSLSVFKGRF